MRKQVTKKGIKAKGAASRLIAKAIEGPEAACRLIRVARRLPLKRAMPRIDRVVLPVPGSAKIHYRTFWTAWYADGQNFYFKARASYV